jgi:hypothetical protein
MYEPRAAAATTVLSRAMAVAFRSVQTEQRQDRHDHHDQADQINDSVH